MKTTDYDKLIKFFDISIIVIPAMVCLIFGIIIGMFIGNNNSYIPKQETTAQTSPPYQIIINVYESSEKEPETTIIIPETTTEIQEDESYSGLSYEPRYGFEEDEVYLLAQLLCGSYEIDGDGEYDFISKNSVETEYNWIEISKVLCVVMNRVTNSDDYPNTIHDVVMQQGQFSVMPRNSKTTPDDRAIAAVWTWCNAYDSWSDEYIVVPETHLYFSSGPNNTNVTRQSWRS